MIVRTLPILVPILGLLAGLPVGAAEPGAAAAGSAPSRDLEARPAEAARPKAERTREAAEPQARPEPRPEPGPSGPERTAEPERAVPGRVRPVRPDLVVEVTGPTTPGQPAIAVVRNVGQGAVTTSFTAVREIESWCEADKLKTGVAPADGGTYTVPPIPAGGSHPVFVLPASESWAATGCYYHVKVRADSWGSVAESDEHNNTGTAHFCPAGGPACY